MQNAPKNLQMTFPDIQKDIVHALAAETTKLIIKDIGNDVFSILVDEARDELIKEQMTMVVCYVDKVPNTKALTLRNEIESMLLKHGLSFSKIRGQGYDGASNMKREVNGLKKLVFSETPSAYYIHCFAHQLQLTRVVVARNHGEISLFFNVVTPLTNLVGASC
ncbi:Zinc finger MYM-type protein 1 [Linum grandiflorum]